MATEHVNPIEEGLDAEELYRLQAQAKAAEDNAHNSREDRVRVLGLILILVAGALILFLRGCPAPGSVSTSEGDKAIEGVSGKSPLEGSISVWIDGKHSIGGVLAKARVSSNGKVSLGKGRWVVSVDAGTEESAVRKLHVTAGVVDAGRVYNGGDLTRSDVGK
ncbi:MAG TPA: hypothetical protein VFG89_03700 [Coriobacteriia bacterium]|nr:hypothetical protein [Coriobacteriia bacterium]